MLIVFGRPAEYTAISPHRFPGVALSLALVFDCRQVRMQLLPPGPHPGLELGLPPRPRVEASSAFTVCPPRPRGGCQVSLQSSPTCRAELSYPNTRFYSKTNLRQRLSTATNTGYESVEENKSSDFDLPSQQVWRVRLTESVVPIIVRSSTTRSLYLHRVLAVAQFCCKRASNDVEAVFKIYIVRFCSTASKFSLY